MSDSGAIAGATACTGKRASYSPRIVLFEAHYDQLNMTTVTTFVHNAMIAVVSSPDPTPKRGFGAGYETMIADTCFFLA